jgi:hypothetical protein
LMNSNKKQLGILLVALSFVFYAGLFLVPLTSLSMESRMILSGSLIVCGEASFWIAVLILGKDMVSGLRDYKSWARRARLFYQERVPKRRIG